MPPEDSTRKSRVRCFDRVVIVAAALLNPALAGGVVEGASALRAAGSAAYDLDADLLGMAPKTVEVSDRGRAAAVLLKTAAF